VLNSSFKKLGKQAMYV